MDFKTSACRSCGAPIIWARSVATNKPMPVDAEPTKIGNVELSGRAPGGEPYATVLAKQALALFGETDQLRLNHYVTCPNAEAHRKDPSR